MLYFEHYFDIVSSDKCERIQPRIRLKKIKYGHVNRANRGIQKNTVIEITIVAINKRTCSKGYLLIFARKIRLFLSHRIRMYEYLFERFFFFFIDKMYSMILIIITNIYLKGPTIQMYSLKCGLSKMADQQFFNSGSAIGCNNKIISKNVSYGIITWKSYEIGENNVWDRRS